MIGNVRWIVWGALLASAGMYAVVGFVVGAEGAKPPAPLVATLAVLSLVQTTAAAWLRKRFVNGPIERGIVDPDSPAGAGRLFPPLLVSWMLAEAISIYGLVLAVVWGFGIEAAALLLFGAMVLAAHAPRLATAVPSGTLHRPDPIG